MIWKEGRQYIGGYSRDVKSGYGELYNSDGSLSYAGWWLADYPNGQGTAYPNRMVLHGVWANGLLQIQLPASI